MRKRIVAAALLAVLALGAESVAQEIDQDIEAAESEAAGARARVGAVEAELRDLQAELAQAEAAERKLTEALLDTRRRQTIVYARLQDARQVLAQRASAAYQAGPAAALEVFLSVRSTSELVSAQAFTESAFGSDAELISTIENTQAELEATQALLERQEAAVAAQRSRLQEIMGQIEVRLGEAQAAATQAGLRVAELKEQKRQLELAAARERARQAALAEAAQNAPPTGDGSYSGSADWDAIAQCESGGNWAANTGNGYWGGLQFAPSTWYGYGGGPFDGEGPFPYPRDEQIAVAERVLASQGPGAWPNCYRSR